MKKTAAYFVIVTIISILSFSSCAEEKATHGTLTIFVMNGNGQDVMNSHVNLATSLDSLRKKLYIKDSYSKENGAVIFTLLLPRDYWFSADGWDDFGSAKVYSGIDHFVVLWLNNPEGKK